MKDKKGDNLNRVDSVQETLRQELEMVEGQMLGTLMKPTLQAVTYLTFLTDCTLPSPC